MWWSTLYKDVGMVVRHCLLCACNKGKPMVTGHQRSREYDGPFRYLLIDFVGPMNPKSQRGHSHMFTCACAWSGWYWALPCFGDTSAIAAELLFYNVICDLAGCPVCLGSDKAPAFVESTVKALSDTFGINQVIGSAYHPQAQSAVERPHREYNMMCKTFMDEVREWDRIAPIFQWSVRTTCKLFSTAYSLGCITCYPLRCESDDS